MGDVKMKSAEIVRQYMGDSSQAKRLQGRDNRA